MANKSKTPLSTYKRYIRSTLKRDGDKRASKSIYKDYRKAGGTMTYKQITK